MNSKLQTILMIPVVITVILLFLFICWFSSQNKIYISNPNQTRHIPNYTHPAEQNTVSLNINDYGWYNRTRNRSFTLLQGLGLKDNSLYISRVTTDIDTLKQICQRTFKCLAFNTSGVLMTLPPSNQLYREITKQNNSLYVLDIDYCDLNVCPPNTVCKYHGPGNYTCSLDSSVHVALSVDSTQFPGIFPLLYSLKQHHTKPLIVHIVVNKKDSQELQIQLECRGLMMSMKIEIVVFDVPANITELIYVKRHEYLSSTANFARFFFHQLFPSLSHILYLDVDTIVLHDISELWNEIVTSDKMFVVIQRPMPNYGFHFYKLNYLSDMYEKRYGKSIDMSTPSFNAGVYGVNLDMWRRENVLNDIYYWMEINKKHLLWFQGTQPIMYLIAYGNIKSVDSCWNVDGLGWKIVERKALSKACILHWNGTKKPWLKTGRQDKNYYLWNQYNKPVCTGHGKCTEGESNAIGKCVCTHGYEGPYCDKLQ